MRESGVTGVQTCALPFATGVWTITGTVAQVNAALAAVAFVPASNNDVNTTITTHIVDAANTGPTDGVINLNVTAEQESTPLNYRYATLSYSVVCSEQEIKDRILTDPQTC